MCSAPKVEEPTKFQAAKTPLMNTAASTTQKSGRAGTILTGRASPAQDYAPGGKKSLLGQ